MELQSLQCANAILQRANALHNYKKKKSGKFRKTMCRQNNQDAVVDDSGEISSSSTAKDKRTVGAINSKENSLLDFKMFESLSPQLQFALLTMSMFLFFGVHNILQEAMMRIPGFKHGVMLGYMEVLGGEWKEEQNSPSMFICF
jgi:hypothetical protein